MTSVRALAALLLPLSIAAAACTAGGGGGGTETGTPTPGATFTNPGALPTPSNNGIPDALPDLTVDQDMLAGSINQVMEQRDSSDCAVVEGCIVADQPRSLLKFDVGVMNVGPVDLHVGGPQDSGNADDFEYSNCHHHYHFKGFAKYTVSNGVGVVAAGAKRAFCLLDINDWGTPNPVPFQSLFDCGDQGIHVGWEDVYDQSLDCQWIDVTDVAPGDYTLSVTVNAENRIPEKGSAPNTVTVPVHIN